MHCMALKRLLNEWRDTVLCKFMFPFGILWKSNINFNYMNFYLNFVARHKNHFNANKLVESQETPEHEMPLFAKEYRT